MVWRERVGGSIWREGVGGKQVAGTYDGKGLAGNGWRENTFQHEPCNFGLHETEVVLFGLDLTKKSISAKS